MHALRRLVTLVIPLVALASSACGSSSGEPLGVVSSPIVGGTDDVADPAVVAVVNETLNLTLCSGVLVGPRTVLTAGHCNFANVTARFGSDASAPTRSVPVLTTLLHPKYTAEGAPYDFALLELETAVTDVAPLPLRTTALSDADVGKTILRHVGFGVSDEATKTGAGHKRSVSYPVTKVTDVLVYSGAPGKQTCDNDSGAPALVVDPDGVERIAGIVSDGPNCHEDGWDGRVDLADVASFVASTRSAWEAPPASAPPAASSGCAAAPGRAPRSTSSLPWLFGVAIASMCLARSRRRAGLLVTVLVAGCGREGAAHPPPQPPLQPQPQPPVAVTAAPPTPPSAAPPEPLPAYLAHLASDGHAQVRDASGGILPAPAADTALLRTYPTWTNKGPITGPAGERLTILTEKTVYDAGEEIRIVHVHEATREGVYLYVMGPKPIYGEYIDGALASPAAAAPPRAYDGRVIESPWEDHNYEVSVHRLPPGRHEIQWRFATLSGPAVLRSNTIVVEVR